MKKQILNFGTPLTKSEQRNVFGGNLTLGGSPGDSSCSADCKGRESADCAGQTCTAIDEAGCSQIKDGVYTLKKCSDQPILVHGLFDSPFN